MGDNSWNTIINRADAEHFNDTATSTAQSNAFSGELAKLYVFNKSLDTDLKISFDDGDTYFTVPMYSQPPPFTVFVTTVYFKTDSGTAEFEMIGLYNEDE